MSKDLLNKLSEIESKLNEIYSELEVLRDQMPVKQQAGINTARKHLEAVNNVLSYQRDIVIFAERKDDISLKKTLNKVSNL